MRASRYLPSRQFSLIAISLLLSGGLVYAADAVTAPARYSGVVVDTGQNTDSAQGDWQASLNTVQTASGASLPPAPDQDTVNGLLKAAQSENVTESLSRTLLVNLTNAKAQGLGSDIPTQNQLIASALAQLNAAAPKTAYTRADLSVVAGTSAQMHTYGNALAVLIAKDSGTHNDYGNTMIAVDAATTANDPSPLQGLGTIQKHYQTLAKDLAALPVPETLAPFHLQLVNDFTKIAATYSGFQSLLSDPLQGLAALQQYNSLTSESARVFINIAQALDKNDILFNKDEPGALWGLLLSGQQ